MPPQPRLSQTEAPAGAIASPEKKHTPQDLQRVKAFVVSEIAKLGMWEELDPVTELLDLIAGCPGDAEQIIQPNEDIRNALRSFYANAFKNIVFAEIWFRNHEQNSWGDYISQMKGGERDVIDWITAKMDEK